MQNRNQNNIILRIIMGCLVSALGFSLVSILGDRVFSLEIARISSWQLFLWYYLIGLSMIIVFIPVVFKTHWRGLSMFIGIWLPLYYIGYLSAGLIESYFFTAIPRSELWLGSIKGLFATAVLAYLLISILFGSIKKTEKVEKKLTPVKRPWFSWVLRIVACAIIYMILYLFVGGLFYQYFFKSFYTNPSNVLIHVEPGPGLFQWLIPLQLIRGALYALVLIPLCLHLNMRRIYLALYLGAMLYLVGGFAPLIMPNPYMLGQLRFYHGIEIFFQNFPLGIAITYLLSPKRRAYTLSSD
jgi:hypothetical protein